MSKIIRITRHGVFETNSSSTHSITINTENFIDSSQSVKDIMNELGEIEIKCGCFGWEIEEHFSVYSKLQYLITYIMRNYDNHNKEDQQVYMISQPEYDILCRVMGEVLEEFCGFIVRESDDPYAIYGYIDHQSLGVPEILFQSKEKLSNFIFNKNSYLVTDNDNH